MKHEEYNAWKGLKDTAGLPKKIEALEKEKSKCYKNNLAKCLGASVLIMNSIAGIGYGMAHTEKDISQYLVPAGIVGAGGGMYLFMSGFGCRKCDDYQREIDRYKRK